MLVPGELDSSRFACTHQYVKYVPVLGASHGCQLPSDCSVIDQIYFILQPSRLTRIPISIARFSVGWVFLLEGLSLCACLLGTCVRTQVTLSNSYVPLNQIVFRFLTDVLTRVIPHLDSLETVEDYLQKLGAKHQQYGVRIEHLDLLALVSINF